MLKKTTRRSKQRHTQPPADTISGDETVDRHRKRRKMVCQDAIYIIVNYSALDGICVHENMHHKRLPRIEGFPPSPDS